MKRQQFVLNDCTKHGLNKFPSTSQESLLFIIYNSHFDCLFLVTGCCYITSTNRTAFNDCLWQFSISFFRQSRVQSIAKPCGGAILNKITIPAGWNTHCKNAYPNATIINHSTTRFNMKPLNFL